MRLKRRCSNAFNEAPGTRRSSQYGERGRLRDRSIEPLGITHSSVHRGDARGQVDLKARRHEWMNVRELVGDHRDHWRAKGQTPSLAVTARGRCPGCGDRANCASPGSGIVVCSTDDRAGSAGAPSGSVGVAIALPLLIVRAVDNSYRSPG